MKKYLNKKTSLIALVVVSVVVVVSVIIINANHRNQLYQEKLAMIASVSIEQKTESLEYGELYTLDDLISVHNEHDVSIVYSLSNEHETVNEDTELIFMNLDDVVLTATISYMDGERVETIHYEVVDTNIPEILGAQRYETEFGVELDLSASISARDKIDGALEVFFEGEIDYNKAGIYPVVVSTRDTNANENTVTIEVVVKEAVANTTIQDNQTNTTNSNTKPSSNTQKDKQPPTPSVPDVVETPKQTEPTYIDASSMLGLVNAARGESGASDLSWSTDLEQFAKVRAKELCSLFSHTRPDGSSFSTVFSGYHWMMMGENIAAGQRSVQEAFKDWMNSPGHRQNILETGYHEIGIAGLNCGDEDTLGYTYYWVQLLGTR